MKKVFDLPFLLYVAAPNFGEVVTFLEDLTKREEVTRLGLKLGLSMRRLRRMRLFPEDMIEAWLRGDDEVDNPCWESLAMALEEVGHIGIASSIKKSKGKNSMLIQCSDIKKGMVYRGN